MAKPPLGHFPIRSIYYRPDRLKMVGSSLPTHEITPTMGWCDDPSSKFYNMLVTLPFEPSHEVLWRQDSLYDVLLVIGHNDTPVIPGHGSAVFIHCARENYAPTEGCIAFKKDDLLEIIQHLNPTSEIVIEGEDPTDFSYISL